MIKNDAKTWPPSLETKTLFEIVRGEVDNAALNIASVQQKVYLLKMGN